MNYQEKIKQLNEFNKEFSKKENLNISISVDNKFSIKKRNNAYVIVLEKKDIETIPLDQLKWGLLSNLNLIKNGRFPSIKKQFIFLLFPALTFLISYFLLLIFNLSSIENLSFNSLTLTFLFSYLGLCHWSRNKILISDKEASISLNKESGINYLLYQMEKEKEADFFIRDNFIFFVFYLFSNYPSFFQRINRLNK